MNPSLPGAVVEEPSARWGLAARGATVEAGAPPFFFALGKKSAVWADEAARLYQQAAAAQRDPATAIAWDAPISHPAEIEDAIVQVMTYLIENETQAADIRLHVTLIGETHPPTDMVITRGRR